MRGTPWKQLSESFGQTLNKIIQKDNGANKSKVSLIIFDNDARRVHENLSPDKI